MEESDELWTSPSSFRTGNFKKTGISVSGHLRLHVAVVQRALDIRLNSVCKGLSIDGSIDVKIKVLGQSGQAVEEMRARPAGEQESAIRWTIVDKLEDVFLQCFLQFGAQHKRSHAWVGGNDLGEWFFGRRMLSFEE